VGGGCGYDVSKKPAQKSNQNPHASRIGQVKPARKREVKQCGLKLAEDPLGSQANMEEASEQSHFNMEKIKGGSRTPVW
jgi:hypothetical protein